MRKLAIFLFLILICTPSFAVPNYARRYPTNTAMQVLPALGSFTSGNCLETDANGNVIDAGAACGSGGSGTVTTVSVVSANGVSGSVANPTTTPAITLTLGAITPTSVNGVTTGAKAYLPFKVQGAKLPSSNPARIDASQQEWGLLFDTTTSQSALWDFVMPQDYGSALSIRLIFCVDSTQSGTNHVQWDISLMKDTPNTDAENVNSNGFDAVNSGDHTLANNQTAGYARVQTITMTNADSVAAGDYCQLKIARNTSVASEATGDARLLGVLIEYTKA